MGMPRKSLEGTSLLQTADDGTELTDGEGLQKTEVTDATGTMTDEDVTNQTLGAADASATCVFVCAVVLAVQRIARELVKVFGRLDCLSDWFGCKRAGSRYQDIKAQGNQTLGWPRLRLMAYCRPTCSKAHPASVQRTDYALCSVQRAHFVYSV